MNYKSEFLKAKADNDWAQVELLWNQLCAETGIEQTPAGTSGNAQAMAEKFNSYANGRPGGIKL